MTYCLARKWRHLSHINKEARATPGTSEYSINTAKTKFDTDTM